MSYELLALKNNYTLSENNYEIEENWKHNNCIVHNQIY